MRPNAIWTCHGPWIRREEITLSLVAAPKIPPGAGNLTTPGNEVEVPDPARAATARVARVARAKAAGAADAALAPHPAPRRGWTPRPPSRRPLGPPDSLGGPRPSPQPREMSGAHTRERTLCTSGVLKRYRIWWDRTAASIAPGVSRGRVRPEPPTHLGSWQR
jgi:hypothetical protein